MNDSNSFGFPVKKAREALEKAVKEVLSSLGCAGAVTLEKPPREMGDYALPCFTLAKTLRKNPALIVADIATEMADPRYSDINNYFELEAKGPYLNFALRTDYLIANVLSSVLRKGADYGTFPPRDEFVILEHTSANPNGPFHVGRARNPIIGDTLARILRKLGFTVEVQYWVNDMGRQAATLSWGKTNLPESSIPPMALDNPFTDKNDHKLVRYYQEAHRRIEDDEKLAGEVDQILYEIEDGNKKTKETVRSYSISVLEGMKESLSRLHIEYDKFVWESASVEDGTVTEVIDVLKKSEYAHRDEGAWYLELEEFGISGRSTKFFFTRGDGTSLYTTRDLAYHLSKLRQCDRAVNILGEDHKLQAQQLKIALGLLSSKVLPESIFYSFVSLAEGKMSTRKAQVVYLDDLIHESLQRAYEEVARRRPQLEEEQKKQISLVVGLGCIRYNIIRVQADKRIVFRWEEALNFEGDSSPFLQYAHARCCGILDKAKGLGYVPPSGGDMEDMVGAEFVKGVHPNERKLIKVLADFPEHIEEAGLGYRPHFIPKYLQDLASALNNFYQSCPVISGEDDDIKRFRLGLVDCTRIVLAEGLSLLGITAPESM